MRKCTLCHEDKKLSEYYSGKFYTDGYSTFCKECKKKYQRNHRKENPTPEWKKKLLLKQVKERTKRLKKIVIEAKNKPCADCKQIFPYMCMDFDHVNGEKEFNIGHYSHVGETRLVDEIAKCEVVCSNCHRIRTHKNGQHLSNMSGKKK